MSELVKTKYHDSEVAKTTDFGHTADALVELANALIDGANQDVENSFVFSGMEVVQTDPASMNVKIKAGLAFDRFSSKILHLDADLVVPVSAASPVQERIDTIEIRYKETDFNNETRAFKDPANGTVMYTSVPTRTLVSIEARCLAGDLGANAAPLTEFGWIKLAEIRVQAAAGAIYTADIRGITAERDTVENSAWTVEPALTFRQGSIDGLKSDLITHKTANSTSSISVHGIRQGHTNGFDADTVDGSHPDTAANANTVIKRSATGTAKVAAPVESDDIARKTEVDTVQSSLTAHVGDSASGVHGSVSSATPSTIMRRDANGRSKVAAPIESDDIARKTDVDALSATIPVASSFINRQLFSTPGSFEWTVPAGIRLARVTVTGGGGGGGSGGKILNSSYYAGNPGFDGGASSIGSLVTALGGVGGTRPAGNVVGPGGAGGAGENGGLDGGFNGSAGSNGNAESTASSVLSGQGAGAGSELGIYDSVVEKSNIDGSFPKATKPASVGSTWAAGTTNYFDGRVGDDAVTPGGGGQGGYGPHTYVVSTHHYYPSGGGGGAGAVRQKIVSVTPGQVLSISVGAGGQGGAQTTGGDFNGGKGGNGGAGLVLIEW